MPHETTVRTGHPNLAAELRQILDVFDGSKAVYQQLLRLAERVEQASSEPVESNASTELTANFGLEPEQEIRARALDIAGRISREAARLLLGTPASVPMEWTPHPARVADQIAAYIRDGARP